MTRFVSTIFEKHLRHARMHTCARAPKIREFPSRSPLIHSCLNHTLTQGFAVRQFQAIQTHTATLYNPHNSR